MTTNLSTHATLDALGDETRRSIVDMLAQGPRGVRAIADDLPVSRSAVSQHLKVLKDAGLVHDTAQGTRRIYRLEPTGFEVLRDYLDVMWRRGLEAFAEAAEAQARSDHQEQP